MLFEELRKDNCVLGDIIPPLRRAKLWSVSFKAPRNDSVDATMKRSDCSEVIANGLRDRQIQNQRGLCPTGEGVLKNEFLVSLKDQF